MATPRDLQDFLAEAQLEHYLNGLRNELKITCVDHLKYVKEEDLEAIGMARPEMRRLKKFYKRECPQGTFGKLRKVSFIELNYLYDLLFDVSRSEHVLAFSLPDFFRYIL